MCVFVDHFTVQSTQAPVGFFPGEFIGESAELVCMLQSIFLLHGTPLCLQSACPLSVLVKLFSCDAQAVCDE